MNKKQIHHAKKLFYLLVFKNSYIEKDKILVSNHLRVDIKLKKMHQQFLTEDNFIKKIIKQLDKRSDLSKDKILQDFERIFTEQNTI